MAYIAPSSTIKLYSGIPYGREEMIFSSAVNREAYFAKHLVATETPCTVVRKTGQLKVSASMSTVKSCNFMSFTNTAFENKIFYCPITDFEYVNNSTTLITYYIDYWYTDMFNASYDSCQIEREQLSVADYNTAVSNPWQVVAPELITSENFAYSVEQEETNSIGDSSMAPSKTINLSIEDNYILGGIDCRSSDLILCMNLTQFDISSIGQTAAQFFMDFDAVSGLPALSEQDGWGAFENGFIRPYAICMLKFTGNETTAKNKFRKAMDWLTLQGLTDCIMSIYVLPAYLVYIGMQLNTGSPNPRVYDYSPRTYSSHNGVTYQNPKINMFPYTFLRCLSPGGDIKEYNISKFTDTASSNTAANFILVANLNGQPSISLVPKHYMHPNFPIFKILGSTESTIYDDINYDERISYQSFPQAAYTTDGYLAFLANQYGEALSSHTAYTEMKMATQFAGNTMGMVGGTVGTVLGIASGNVGQAIGGIQSVAGGFGSQLSVAEQAQMYNEANRQRNTSVDATQTVKQNTDLLMNDAKPAHAANEYHPGSEGGYEPYQISRLMFTVYQVYLQPKIIKQIDDYFTAYGYTSHKIHVPYVCNYVKGSSSNSEIPVFLDMDGAKITYVQTTNMHVKGVIGDSQDFIENMFNAGIRFIKGD